MQRRRLDYRGEMGRPEQSSSQGKGLDVRESTRKHQEERVQLKSIATRLHPVKEYCEKAIANQDQKIANRREELGSSADLSQITKIIQAEFPPLTKIIQVKDACNTLIDYTKTGTTDKYPNAAKDQIIGFLETNGQPGTPMHSLAKDIKHLFTQHAPREGAQVSSSTPDRSGAEQTEVSPLTTTPIRIESNREEFLNKTILASKITREYLNALGKSKDGALGDASTSLKHLYKNLRELRDYSLYNNHSYTDAINAYNAIETAYKDGTYEKYAKKRCQNLGFSFAQGKTSDK